MAPEAPIEINVMRVSGAWGKSVPGYRAKIVHWCESALKGARGGAVSVVLADDAFVHDLNLRYRHKNKATNVLSFPSDEKSELGDIVLAYQTVQLEARAQRKSMTRHTAHLVVHGCLHLAGFDHEEEKEAVRMEKREASILATFGMPNPYEGSHVTA